MLVIKLQIYAMLSSLNKEQQIELIKDIYIEINGDNKSFNTIRDFKKKNNPQYKGIDQG
jgi:hypothetical protein